ncbi:MAG: glycosyltransferase family 2 protein [Gelidibacter sp.]
MSATALVSIIIPTYNRAHLIGETLDSVLAQTYTNWECIVVDDGSEDNTDDVVTAYVKNDARFQYYHRPKDRAAGGNAARNYGFELSKGEIINWVDSDDLILPDHLSIHVEKHNSMNEKLDCVITNAEVFEGFKNNIIRHWSNIYVKSDVITEMLSVKVLWPIGCVSWKKKSIKGKPFNENLASSQEWTFHLKQLIANIYYEILGKTTYLARSHHNRIGKVISQSKINSTYLSRVQIFDTLNEAKILTKEREYIILQNIVKNLFSALQLKYYSSAHSIAMGLLKRFSLIHHYKRKILMVVFLAYPFYIFTGKGYRFFNISVKI